MACNCGKVEKIEKLITIVEEAYREGLTDGAEPFHRETDRWPLSDAFDRLNEVLGDEE